MANCVGGVARNLVRSAYSPIHVYRKSHTFPYVTGVVQADSTAGRDGDNLLMSPRCNYYVLSVGIFLSQGM